jgi:alpha-glucosidase
LKLRHDNAAFRDGSYVPLESGNPNVFAFGRKASDNEVALVVLNTSPAPQSVHITGMPGTWPGFQHLLMASPLAPVPLGQTLKIAPYGVLIAATK